MDNEGVARVNQAFEAEDLSNKMGENKNNETEEEMSQSRIFSSSIAIEAAAADNESGEGAETGKVRKVTKEALFSTREQKRAECVRKCRAVAEELTKDNAIKEMNYLLEDKEFSNALFFLFDNDFTGVLDQSEWIDMLRINTNGPKFEHISQERRNDMVNMIDNATFIICDDNPISQENFRKIVNSRGVRENLFRLADADSSGDISVEEVIDFLVVLSKPRHTDDFDCDKIRRIEEVFNAHLPPNQTSLTLTEFKNIMSSKNAFFVERVFKIFDIDGDGTISLAEFLDKMYQYAGSQSDAEKVLFLFKVYDIDGDGMLQIEELERIMEECLRENGLRLPDSDVQDLSYALYEEALGDGEDIGEISIDQLKEALARHDGLLENLTNSISRWLLPPKPKPKPTLKQKFLDYWHRHFSRQHIRQNIQFFAFIAFILIINFILFVTRAVYFKDFANLDGSKPNPFYMLSRANGRCLLFNSMMVLVVVLRYTITSLRNLGLSKILPLDHNIYIHKYIGSIIFVQAWFHTIMHLINFGVNIQPDPVKFVQLNTEYWPAKLTSAEAMQDGQTHHANWLNLGYQVPDGCEIILESNNCPQDSIDLTKNVTACQVCTSGQPWNYGDWLFTARPGVFGLIPGMANPAGVGLIIILTIMVVCALPMVRRSGYFQVFYFTHLLYWLYMVLLIIHAPAFWKWVIAPFVIFLVEKIFRVLSTIMGQGKSFVIKAKTLPSRVTTLQIKRPDGFKYSPGDWAFIKIPTIAKHEWHPFTISSAPENREFVTFHIRGVGQWTNRLYDYVENKKKQENDSRRSTTRSIRFSSKRKNNDCNNSNNPESKKVVKYADGKDRFDLVIDKKALESKPKCLKDKNTKLVIHLDGPFGAPASNIFRAEHAVLVSTGIGVTPFSSILQSIMYRYRFSKRECPRCQLRWITDLAQQMQSLRKVDFIWINRDQKSFEWFLNLLSEMEAEQQEEEHSDFSNTNGRFLDLHLYFTQALARNDMRAVGMHLAMDLMHRKSGGKDVMTGLKAKTNAGRPNWDKIFQKLQDERKGKITVFYCGNPVVANILRAKCEEYGFDFRKEVF